MAGTVGGVKFDPLNLESILANVQKSQAASHKSVMGNMSKMNSLIASIQQPGVSGGGSSGGASYGGTGVIAQPVKVSGNVKSWIGQAEKLLGLGPQYTAGIAQMIQHESGGNPNSINRWDSNAKAGHPSQGLMQTIPGTFKAYALPGHNSNILDPVSNIAAGVRYALSRYGKGMILAGGRHDSSGKYIGY